MESMVTHILEKSRKLGHKVSTVPVSLGETGFNFSYTLMSSSDFVVPMGIITDIHLALLSVVKSATFQDMDKVFREVDLVFYDPNTVDVVVNPNPSYRAVYFGKAFINMKALKRLFFNLSAKYTKHLGVRTILRLYNVERD